MDQALNGTGIQNLDYSPKSEMATEKNNKMSCTKKIQPIDNELKYFVWYPKKLSLTSQKYRVWDTGSGKKSIPNLGSGSRNRKKHRIPDPQHLFPCRPEKNWNGTMV
jgi:hypothetical protein